MVPRGERSLSRQKLHNSRRVQHFWPSLTARSADQTAVTKGSGLGSPARPCQLSATKDSGGGEAILQWPRLQIAGRQRPSAKDGASPCTLIVANLPSEPACSP